MKRAVSSAIKLGEGRPEREEPDTRLRGRSLWFARAVWLVVCLIVGAMVVVNAPHLVQDTLSGWQVGEALPAARTLFPTALAFARYLVALKIVVAAVFAGTGIFLAWRQPDDWMVLFTSATLVLLVYLFGFGLTIETIRYPPFLEEVFPAVRAVVPTLIAGSLIGLFFLFPNGRFYPRWNMWVALFGVLASASFFAAGSNSANQGTYESLAPLAEEWGWYLFVYSLLGALAVALISRVIYYRRMADAAERQQIKLVLFGLGTVVAVPLLQSAFVELLTPLSYAWRHFLYLHAGLIVPLVLPMTIGMSVLRYRLWEVDLLLNRALVYGVLTAVVLVLYGGSVGLLSAALPSHANLLTSFVAVGVAAIAVFPARRALQSWVDGWLPAKARPIPADEEEKVGAATTGIGWRLAHGAWVGLFVFLLWQLLLQLSKMRYLFGSIQNDYLVRTSARLLPASAAPAFIHYVNALRIGTTIVFWLAAGLIFWRRRHDGFALYVSFILMAAPFGIVLGGNEGDVLAFVSFVAVVAQVFLPFLFPDGRFVPRSTKWRAILAGFLLVTPLAVYPVLRLGFPEYAHSEVGYLTFIITLAMVMGSGLASQIYRYRRVASATQRQQMKWVVVGLGTGLVWILWGVLWTGGVLGWLGISESVTTMVMLHLTILASAALPVTIGFAILRYRLWQVDVVINRALVFGGLTLLVTAVYVLVVGVLGVLFHAGGNVALSILATGLIAVLFNPLRQRLQQAVNRLMYGERDDPVTVLSQLGKRLEETAVPGDTLPALVETVAQTLKLPYVALTVEGEVVAAAGATSERPAHSYPLIYQSQAIGRLVVSTRAGGEAFTASEERLLRNVARQAGPAVYAEQLTNQLQRSRERLITAREEERRRLRRDLHDGLGPRLATLTLKVSAAKNLLQTDPEAANALLAEVKGESQSAIKEIRRVVEGLRPSALDQLGLVSALRAFAEQNGNGRTQVRFLAPDSLPALPAAVEVAAYRIVTEAVTNAVRHARAKVCVIRLEMNDALYLEIRDDGDGLPVDCQPGVGLASMRERAVELGGRFEIESDPGKGTIVSVLLPVSRG